MTFTRVEAPWPDETYSDSVTVRVPGGRWIFVSGQIGADLDGNLAKGGPQAEADQLFERVRLALEAAGGRMEHVVKVAAWMVKPDENFKYFSNARGRAFAGNYPSCALTTEVPSLSFGALYEMDAQAFVPDE